MALAVDTTTSHGNGTSSATSITWSHTCSGSERLLIVAVPCSRAVAPTVTYNSVSMTLAVSRVNGTNRAYIFYLINPASGANNVTVSYGSNLQYYVAAAVSFTGADQTDPIGTSNTAAGTAGNKSLSMTTEADGSYLVDCIGSVGTVHTAGAGQTAFNDSQNRVSSYKSAPTAGTNGTSWTGSPSTAYAYALLEVLASPTQDISPTGIASAEAFGDHVVSLEVNCSGITSAEAFGDHVVSLEINPTGITSAEAFGDHEVSAGLFITPDGIASAEAFGDHVVSLEINNTGITSGEVFGSHTVSLEINPSGITSAEAFGDHEVYTPADQDISPSGIPSGEAFPPDTLGTNLLACWKLDETSGTRADSWGDNDFSPVGTVGSGTGIISNAVLIDAVTDNYLTADGFGDLKVGSNDDFTVSVWVKFNVVVSNQIIIGKWGDDRTWYLGTYFSGTGRRFRFVTNVISGDVVSDNAGYISADTWYHVVAWHEAATNTVGIKVNAYDEDTSTYVNVWSGLNNEPVTIGRTETITASIDGLVDEAKFWDRLLTDDEKTRLYNSGSGVSCPDAGSHTVYTPADQDILPTGIASAEAFGSHVVSLEINNTGITSAEAIGDPVVSLEVNPSGITSVEIFGDHTVSTPSDQDVLPSGIASIESFGSHTVSTPSDQDILPSGIASAEAFGDHIVSLEINANGIASAETFGDHIIESGLSISPDAIASAEAFGDHIVSLEINANGIASAETFGDHIVSLEIDPSGIASTEAFGNSIIESELSVSPDGIASAEAFGDHIVSLEINANGIASQEAFGDHIVSLEIDPSGISSQEAFGTQVVSLEINSSGIASAEAFGDHIVSIGQTISPDGIASQEAFGDHIVSLEINCTGIASQEAFGTQVVSLEINPSGITSSEAFGGHVVTTEQTISFTGIISAEAFGSHTVYTPADQDISPSGIISAEAFGDHIVSLEINCTGIASQEAFGDHIVSLEINPSGIASSEAFGDHVITTEQTISFDGIASQEAFGDHIVSLEINCDGIASQEAFGSPSVYDGPVISPDGIASQEAFGTHVVSLEINCDGIASGEAFGSHRVSISYSHTASGGAVGGGTAGFRLGYRYFPTGYSSEGAGIRFGYGQDPVPVRVLYIFEQEFLWDIDSSFDVGIKFIWNTGEVPLRAYRVLGCCHYPTDDGDGLGLGIPGGCEILPLETLDSQCTGALGKNQFVQTVIAKSVTDLCDKLHEQGWDWPICSIQKFTRPLDVRLATDDCNQLVEVEFCSIPECLELCVDEYRVIHVGATFTALDTFLSSSASGGVVFGGAAICRIVPPAHVASGGIVFGGSAAATSTKYSYIGSGGIVFGGESSAISNYYRYEGSGGIEFSGKAGVVTPNSQYTGSGGFSLSGSAEVTVRYSHASTGNSSDTPFIPGILWGGSADISRFYYIASGGITMGGSAVAYTSVLRHIASGGIVFGGEANFSSPYWSYIGTGGITMGGSAEQSYEIAAWTASGTGGMTFGGTAPARSSEDGEYWYTGSGGFVMGGEAPANITKWRYKGSGGISLGGTSITSSTWGGEYTVPVGVNMDIVVTQVVYSQKDLDENTLDGLSTRINTRCVNCDSIPILLELDHNLERVGVLSDFMLRSGLELPDIISLRYSRVTDSWQSNLHYRGISQDGVQNERWSILIEWSCVDELGGVELGNFFWKFSMYILRKNLVTGSDSDTRLLIVFPPNELCNEVASTGFDFSFSIDTEKKYVTTDIDIDVDTQVIFDNTGLFASDSWQQNPVLKFAISESGEGDSILRQDIRSIFPAEPLLVEGNE